MADGEVTGGPTEPWRPAEGAPGAPTGGPGRPDFQAAGSGWSRPWSPDPTPEQEPTAFWPFAEPGPGGDTVPAPAPVAAPPGPRRGPRAGAVVGVAALTALVIGGGAGYGGARLADRTEAPALTATSAPVPTSAASGSAVAPAPLPPGQSTSTVEVARRLLPSTVMIEVGSGTGSGFVLDREGHVMTNNHVVAGAGSDGRVRVVFSDGRRTTATLVGRSPSYDLAVIKVRATAGLVPVQTGDSARAQVGEPVVAIGSPLGLPGTVTQGIVSAVDRPLVVNESSSADAPTAYINGIQTDAPINPGNSGGPLVDASARVIGVNSAILTMGSSQGQAGNIGLGFAIPVNQALVIGKQLVANGKATYPVIGASVRDDATGAQLTTVDAGGPARSAGLREGDVVTTVAGRTVTNSQELIVAIRTRRPGESVELGYTRGGQRSTARVVLGGKEG